MGELRSLLELLGWLWQSVSRLPRSPLAFETNTTLLQEAGMRQMRLVLDALRLHPYVAL